VPGLEDQLPIWNINALAEGFLELHLDSLSDYERALTEWDQESARVHQELCQFIPHSNLFPSHAFITVVTDTVLGVPLYEQCGIFAADVSAKFNDGRHHTRIGIRSKKDNDYLLYALKTILKDQASLEPQLSSASRGTR